jgi:hypothetical protein
MLPRAPIEPEGMFDGLSAASIFFGAFVDVAATVILSTLLVVWLAPEVANQDEAATRRALVELAASSSYVASNLALGALCTVLGVLITSLEPAPPQDAVSGPFWAEVVAWLLILPAGMIGGALAAALAREPH